MYSDNCTAATSIKLSLQPASLLLQPRRFQCSKTRSRNFGRYIEIVVTSSVVITRSYCTSCLWLCVGKVSKEQTARSWMHHECLVRTLTCLSEVLISRPMSPCRQRVQAGHTSKQSEVLCWHKTVCSLHTRYLGVCFYTAFVPVTAQMTNTGYETAD